MRMMSSPRIHVYLFEDHQAQVALVVQTYDLRKWLIQIEAKCRHCIANGRHTALADYIVRHGRPDPSQLQPLGTFDPSQRDRAKALAHRRLTESLARPGWGCLNVLDSRGLPKLYKAQLPDRVSRRKYPTKVPKQDHPRIVADFERLIATEGLLPALERLAEPYGVSANAIRYIIMAQRPELVPPVRKRGFRRDTRTHRNGVMRKFRKKMKETT